MVVGDKSGDGEEWKEEQEALNNKRAKGHRREPDFCRAWK